MTPPRKPPRKARSYHDDIGQCWPAGLPVIMTRVWPIAMVQMPTAIYMVSGFMNSVRIIYLDGRKHTDPDLVVRSFNGESIGHWEGDTLVVDTTGFVDDHHWIDNGIPASDALHIIERMRLINNGATLEIEYTMTDPKSWEGEWKMTKRWRRVDDTGHHRGVVLARSQRAYAEHQIVKCERQVRRSYEERHEAVIGSVHVHARTGPCRFGLRAPLDGGIRPRENGHIWWGR